MTKIQFEKLEKIFRLAEPSARVNVVISIHSPSKKDAKRIIKSIPKNFRRKSKINESSSGWMEATKSNVYGLGNLEVTTFYPEGKGGE